MFTATKDPTVSEARACLPVNLSSSLHITSTIPHDALVESSRTDAGRDSFPRCKFPHSMIPVLNDSNPRHQILSVPSVFQTIGMAAGIILVIGLGTFATITGYVIGQFKLRYPHVHNMADAGMILYGPIGREVLGYGMS
jgi:hypothetical protein